MRFCKQRKIAKVVKGKSVFVTYWYTLLLLHIVRFPFHMATTLNYPLSDYCVGGERGERGEREEREDDLANRVILGDIDF